MLKIKIENKYLLCNIGKAGKLPLLQFTENPTTLLHSIHDMAMLFLSGNCDLISVSFICIS